MRDKGYQSYESFLKDNRIVKNIQLQYYVEWIQTFHVPSVLMKHVFPKYIIKAGFEAVPRAKYLFSAGAAILTKEVYSGAVIF